MSLSAQDRTLARVAATLSEHEILYALGGSSLLRVNEVIEETERVTLMIDPADIRETDALLSQLGQKHQRIPSPHYATRYFNEFTIDGYTFHIMSGLMLHYKGYLYTYPFDRSAIVAMPNLGGVYVACTSLEDWYVLYQMMPRRERYVSALERYFASHGLEHMERFQTLRRQPLPPAVTANILRWSAMGDLALVGQHA